MGPLRILVADDHEIVRIGICSILGRHQQWCVCGTANNGWEAVERAKQLRPDLVVLDVAMPQLNGFGAARHIMREQPGARILLLTFEGSEQTIRAALEIGVSGFVLKSDISGDLALAVEAIFSGRTFFTRRVGQFVLDGFLQTLRSTIEPVRPKDELTSRELEVLQLLAEGKCSKEVAALLNLSVKTVETHRANTMRKLGIHTIAELVLYAVRAGIVHVPLPYVDAALSIQHRGTEL